MPGLDVRTYGTGGPAVVVLHGGPGAAGYMAPVARELSDSFRAIEPLQRRSGSTPVTVAQHVADLGAVVREFAGDSPPALVGSSWGAQLALAFAAEHPRATGPIVLIGSGTFTAESSREFDRRLALRLTPGDKTDLKAAANVEDPDEALAREAAVLMAPYSFDLLSAHLEMDWVDARGMEETWADFLRLRDSGIYPERFRSIASPVLMLHGDTDPHPGELIRDSLLPVLPQLEYVELARCGHYPWLERFGRAPFFDALRGWLGVHAAT